jgi:hypothetical protein
MPRFLARALLLISAIQYQRTKAESLRLAFIRLCGRYVRSRRQTDVKIGPQWSLPNSVVDMSDRRCLLEPMRYLKVHDVSGRRLDRLQLRVASTNSRAANRRVSHGTTHSGSAPSDKDSWAKVSTRRCNTDQSCGASTAAGSICRSERLITSNFSLGGTGERLEGQTGLNPKPEPQNVGHQYAVTGTRRVRIGLLDAQNDRAREDFYVRTTNCGFRATRKISRYAARPAPRPRLRG